MPNTTYNRLDDNGLLYLLTLLKGEIDNAGEENVIESITVNGTVATPDANKNVDIEVPDFSVDDTGDTHTFAIFDNGSVQDASKLFAVSYASSRNLMQVMLKGENEVSAFFPDKTYVDGTFRTEAQVQAAIDDAIAGISGIEYEIVNALPATGEKGTIYLLSNSGTAPDIYDEYIWIDGTPGHYEKIGTTAVDLSGYVQASEMHALTNSEIDAIYSQVFG